MSKVEQIKQFIDRETPRRKDLIKFIIVNVSKIRTEENYNPKEFRGYYSTNITRWKYNGHIQVNPITKRYSLTKIGKKSVKSLYSLPLEVQLKRFKKSNRALTTHILELRADIRKLKSIISVYANT